MVTIMGSTHHAIIFPSGAFRAVLFDFSKKELVNPINRLGELLTPLGYCFTDPYVPHYGSKYRLSVLCQVQKGNKSLLNPYLSHQSLTMASRVCGSKEGSAYMPLAARWRQASYKKTAAATDTFRLWIIPCMGM